MAKGNTVEKGTSGHRQRLRERFLCIKLFDNNLHDRWIETDTGWRIILGRGLDIFQKPDDKYTLGFLDQRKRRCKATAITYTRSKPVDKTGGYIQHEGIK